MPIKKTLDTIQTNRECLHLWSFLYAQYSDHEKYEQRLWWMSMFTASWVWISCFKNTHHLSVCAPLCMMNECTEEWLAGIRRVGYILFIFNIMLCGPINMNVITPKKKGSSDGPHPPLPRCWIYWWQLLWLWINFSNLWRSS